MADTVNADALIETMRKKRGYTVPSIEMACRLDPEFMLAYDNLLDAARGYSKPQTISPKIRELVLVAILLTDGRDARLHMQQALGAGANAAEVLDILKICCATVGAPAFLSGCATLHSLLESSDDK